MQSKKDMHTEIIMNMVVGALLSWVVLQVLLPLILIYSPNTMASIIVPVMFVTSYLRTLAFRKWYNNKLKKSLED